MRLKRKLILSDIEREAFLLYRRAGLVKRFDPLRGFGFVIDGETGDEVLLNESTLRSFGQSSVSADSFVELNTVQTERGYQAREVLRVVPNEVVATNTFDATELHVVAGDFVAARVKWYDVRKGFGFVNVFGSPEDLFVHVKTLHQGGLEIVAVGEAISVRLTDSFLHWWFVGQLWGNPS